MRDILRRYIGRGGKSVKEIAVIVQRKRWGTRERRVISWRDNPRNMNAPELLALMELLGEDFTNEILAEIGYTVEAIEGFTSPEELGHGINEVLASEYFSQPGNGPRRVRVLLRLRRLVGGYISGLRQKRLAA